MKALKYLIIGVLVLFILFLGMGLIQPSVNYGAEISVDKPIKECWAVSQDESLYEKWLEGFKSFELIEGEWMKPGSKYKVVVDPGDGQPEFEMTETLVSINEFQNVEMHFDSEFMIFEQVMSFSESGNETLIKSDSKVKAKGLIMKSMFAIMETFGGSFTKQEQKNFESLKRLIVKNSKDYYPDPIENTLDTNQDIEENQ